MNSRYRSFSAFTIMEMVVALSVMGVFFLIAGTLFVQCIKTFGKIGQFENRQDTWRRMTLELGRDVWIARRIRIRGTSELICRIGTNNRVEWRIGHHGEITRVLRRGNGTGESNRWPGIGAGVHFERAAHAVELCRRQQKGKRMIVLPAELRLAEAISRRRR